MSAETAFEIFGIPGLVLFIVGGICYKIYQCYDIQIASNDFLHQIFPSKTLKNTWEHESGISNNYKRGIFAKEIELNEKEEKQFIWDVSIPEKKGNVYIYRDIVEKPPISNNGQYYLRVKLKNVDKNDNIIFQKKSFFIENGKWVEPKINFKVEKVIYGNGIHYFEPSCRLGEIIGDVENEKKIEIEQLGIFITAKNKDVNIVIEEAYFGEKWWMINLLPCISNKYILLVKPKVKTSE